MGLGVGPRGPEKDSALFYIYSSFSHLKEKSQEGPRMTNSPVCLGLTAPGMNAGLAGLKQGEAQGNQDKVVTLEGPNAI